MGSPPSAAPSPLPNPHSQPASDVPPGEQTMPTLSPHPPTVPMLHSPIDKPPVTPSEPPKSQDSIVSPSQQPTVDPCRIAENQSSAQPQPPTLSLKRPVLTSKEYENALLEEEQTLDLLYDYSTLEAW